MAQAFPGEIASASPGTLGLSMLKADVQAARLDDRAQIAAVSDALADGEATAKDVRLRFPGFSPREIARAFGVPVEAGDDDPLVGLIYTRGLAPLDRALADGLAKRLLGEATVEDVFIAHELYHHLEATRPEVPIARRHQATLLRIGKWRWRTGIAMLSEIAAGAFAQALLDLPCHPKVLDYLARPLHRGSFNSNPLRSGRLHEGS